MARGAVGIIYISLPVQKRQTAVARSKEARGRIQTGGWDELMRKGHLPNIDSAEAGESWRL